MPSDKEKILEAVILAEEPTLGSRIRTMSGFDGTVDDMLPLANELQAEGKITVESRGRGYYLSPVHVSTSGNPVSEGARMFKDGLDEMSRLSGLFREVSQLKNSPHITRVIMKELADGLEDCRTTMNGAKNKFTQEINRITLLYEGVRREMDDFHDVNLDDEGEDDGESGVPRQGSDTQVLEEGGQEGTV